MPVPSIRSEGLANDGGIGAIGAIATGRTRVGASAIVQLGRGDLAAGGHNDGGNDKGKEDKRATDGHGRELQETRDFGG